MAQSEMGVSTGRKCDFETFVANPCCIFNIYLDKGSIVVALLGLGIGIIFVIAGIYLVLEPSILIKHIGESRAVDLGRAIIGTINTGIVYIAYGLATIILNIILLVAVKRQSRLLCITWAFFTNITGALMVIGPIKYSLIDTEAEMLVLCYPVFLIVLQLGFITIVSMYAAVLKNIDQYVKRLNEALSAVSKDPPDPEWTLQSVSSGYHQPGSQVAVGIERINQDFSEADCELI